MRQEAHDAVAARRLARAPSEVSNIVSASESARIAFALGASMRQSRTAPLRRVNEPRSRTCAEDSQRCSPHSRAAAVATLRRPRPKPSPRISSSNVLRPATAQSLCVTSLLALNLSAQDRCAERSAKPMCAPGCLYTRSHLLRHTQADRLLAGGSSLEEVVDVRRQRSLNTTLNYAKLANRNLVEAALPRPGSATVAGRAFKSNGDLPCPILLLPSRAALRGGTKFPKPPPAPSDVLHLNEVQTPWT